MNNTKKLVLSSLLPMLCCSAHKTEARFTDHFKDMVQSQQKMLQEMEAQFNDFAKEFDDIFAVTDDQTKQTQDKKDALDMNVTENDTHVTITFKNIVADADKIESPVNDASLSISIPTNDETIKLSVAKHPQADVYLLNVATKHEARSEKNSDDKKPQAAYYAYSSQQMQQTLPAAVQLENSEIEYNETEKQLTIKLPKKVTKRIAVAKK